MQPIHTVYIRCIVYLLSIHVVHTYNLSSICHIFVPSIQNIFQESLTVKAPTYGRVPTQIFKTTYSKTLKQESNSYLVVDSFFKSVLH